MAQEDEKYSAASKKDSFNEFAKTGREKTYRDQAVFFLNAYCADDEMAELYKVGDAKNGRVPVCDLVAKKMKRAELGKNDLKYKLDTLQYGIYATFPNDADKLREHCWDCVKTMAELDVQKGEDGCSLEEVKAHNFLEKEDEPQTAVKMRQVLKEIDVDSDKHMSFLEYAVWKFQLDIDDLMSRPQGTNEELEKAEKALKEIRAEIKTIEEKKAKLEKASSEKQANGELTHKAKIAFQELQQLLSADNLPLNRKFLTAQASLRAAQKAGNLAAQGKLWWLQRELSEAEARKPKSQKK